jgi:hypothetical protein
MPVRVSALGFEAFTPRDPRPLDEEGPMMKNTSTTDVTLADEYSHLHELPEDQRAVHFQDHIGMGIFGKAGDKDVLVTCVIYHVGGRLWGLEDAALIQTNIIVAATDDRVMKNTKFVANRMDPLGHFDNFEVTRDADQVVWKAGNRQIIARPPCWELKGEHMGVDMDITLTGIGTSIPYHGTWDGLATTGVAGNEHLATAEGSFTYEGVTFTLDEGWAVRERTCLGQGWDVPSLLGSAEGYIWGWAFSDAVKVFVYAQEGSGHFAGRIFLEDHMINVTSDETVVEPLGSWVDPLTHATHNTSWRITMTTDAGTVELNVVTWSRCLFGFHLVEAYTTHHGALGRAGGRFVHTDGTVVALDDCLAYFEQGFATPLAAV